MLGKIIFNGTFLQALSQISISWQNQCYLFFLFKKKQKAPFLIGWKGEKILLGMMFSGIDQEQGEINL